MCRQYDTSQKIIFYSYIAFYIDLYTNYYKNIKN